MFPKCLFRMTTELDDSFVSQDMLVHMYPDPQLVYWRHWGLYWFLTCTSWVSLNLCYMRC